MKEFDKYTSSYDLNNIKIKLKYNHSYRVTKLSEKYAKELSFNDYDVKLAKIIGLLHDIGRFEQLKIYDSFDDFKTIDHADLGVKILFGDGLIEKFWKNKDDYDVIKFAIKNHNKFEIENTSDERKIKFAKLIRDADKVDIMYIYGVLNELNIKGNNENISEEIIKGLREYKTISREKIKNINDSIAVYFGFAFDINYDIALKEFKNYIESFYNNLKYKDKFTEVYNIVNKYIDERIDKYVR